MRETRINHEIFNSYKTMVEHLISVDKAALDDDLHFSMNLNSVICMACYVEGFLEHTIKVIVEDHYAEFNKQKQGSNRSVNILSSNLYWHLFGVTSKTTGVDGHDEMFSLLLNKSFFKNDDYKDVSVPIRILFVLRNVIAHGKEISYCGQEGHLLTLDPDNWVDFPKTGVREGYKAVEEFLIQNKVISTTFDKEENLGYMFTDDVVNYFWSKVMDFVDKICEFVTAAIRDLKLSIDDVALAMFPNDGTYYMNFDGKGYIITRKGDDVSFQKESD